MVRRALFVLAMSMCCMGAGCLSSTPFPWATAPGDLPWEPHGCDPSGAVTVSGNTPLLPALADAPVDVVTRVAKALGTTVVSRTPSDTGVIDAYVRTEWTEWETDDGQIRYALVDRAYGYVEYTTDRRWPGPDAVSAEAEVTRFLEALPVPDIVPYTFQFGTSVPGDGEGTDDAAPATATGRFQVNVEGAGIGGGSWQWTETLRQGGNGVSVESTLRLEGLYDVEQATIGLPVDQARSIAAAFMACLLTEEGLDEDYTYESTRDWGRVVRHDSLAYHFLVCHRYQDGSQCSNWAVDVDAVTGAVLFHGRV